MTAGNAKTSPTPPKCPPLHELWRRVEAMRRRVDELLPPKKVKQ